MRKALIYLIFPFLCAFSVQAEAQFIPLDTVGIPRDRWIHMKGEFCRQIPQRDSILIGDQVEYGFVMKDLEDGVALGCLQFSKTPMDITRDWTSKVISRRSQGAGKPDLIDVEMNIRIGLFEEGRAKLPPIIVGRIFPSGQMDTVFFDPIEVEVKTIPMDTLTFQRHGMKSIIDVPYGWDEFKYDLKNFIFNKLLPLLPWLAGGAWLIMIIIVGVCIWRLRNRGDIAGNAIVNEPAHITALRKLDGLRSNAMWVPEKQKAFYSGVTDALREYISRRYGIGAMEMTTAELFDEMKEMELSQEQLTELHELFDRADFVKFAKYVASDEDNAATVPVAVRFVTLTYQADLQAQQETAEDVEKKK